MYLNEEQLKALQQVELEMLVEIDRICRQNNICYTLDSCTLSGAVLNKGRADGIYRRAYRRTAAGKGFRLRAAYRKAIRGDKRAS